MAAGMTVRTPYAYRAGTSMVHRANAGVKLAVLLALSIFAYASVPGLAAAAILVIVLSCAAGINPVTLLRGSRPLLLLAAFVVLLRSFDIDTAARNITFDRAGFPAGLREGLCIPVSFAAGALLFSTSTMSQIHAALSAVEGVFRRGKPCRLSLALALMLGFIPRFFETWETLNLACDARSYKRGLPRLVLLVPLLCEAMFVLAEETALAMEARNISG